MSKTTTVSAKVPERLKKKAKRAGEILKEVPCENIVKAVRETRESA